MWRKLTMSRLTAVILFILLFAMATSTPVDPDTWWHLRSGEHQLDNFTVVGEDLFSHTRLGEPWTNHSWGSQNVMVLVYRLFGGQGDPADRGAVGLALMSALLAASGMMFVFASSDANVYIRAFAVVFGAAAAAVFWSARPQMFTFFFSTVVYFLLMQYKWQHKDRLWLIPVVMLIWGNMHAGYATAFILMLGVIAGEVAGNIFGPKTETLIGWQGIGKLLLIMVVSGLVLVINPFGLAMYKVPFATVNITVLQDFIQEWSSPDFHQRETWPFLLLLLGATGFAGLSKKRIDWSDLALLTGTGLMAFLSGRNIAIFAVVAAPVLARHADAFLRDRGVVMRPSTRVTPRMARLNWLLLILIALIIPIKVSVALSPEQIRNAHEERLPAGVAAYINETYPEGQMFNSYNWGGYLMYAAKGHPVYVDGRTDLYGNEFLTEYLQVTFLQKGYAEVFDKYDIGFVVIEVNSMLAQTLRSDPAWTVAYEDELAVLFVPEES